MTPCSLTDIYRRFGRTYCTSFRVEGDMGLDMDVIVPLRGAKILRDYVPTQLEVGAFHCHTRENPKSPTEF